MNDSKFSELASMYTEATALCNGIETMNYVESFGHSTGDEPPSLLITHNSTYPYWNGPTTSTPASSSTRCRWRVLSAALRLATVSPDLQTILIFPPKGQPYITPTGWKSWTKTWRLNSRPTANTTYIYAKESSNDW